MRPPAGFRDSCTRASVIAIVAIPIGTLTKKIASQPRPSVSTPPTSGPTATAAPVVAPHSPSAVPRSGPWKATARSASAVANMSAPPTPWSARARLSMSGEPASPQSRDAAVKIAIPVTNTRRRPIRSATDPPVSRNAASASA